jgi:hypothetical protein
MMGTSNVFNGFALAYLLPQRKDFLKDEVLLGSILGFCKAHEDLFAIENF